MSDSVEIPTTNLIVDHDMRDKSVGKCLRQRRTTGNGNINVINAKAAIFPLPVIGYRYCHNNRLDAISSSWHVRKPTICR